MTYKIDIKNWGRVFTVPCSVVDNFLKDADGDYLKVLLCIISFGNGKIESEKICSLCGVDETTVKKAISYWNNSGVISSECENNDDFVGFTPVFENKTIDNKVIEQFNAENKRSETTNFTPAYISEAINSSADLRAFFDEVQNILGRNLKYSDQCAYMYIYEEYGYSPASILLMVDYCNNQGKASPNYIKTVAKDWFSKDIISYDDVEKYIIELNEYHSYESIIKRQLEINKKLSSKQAEFVNSWSKSNVSPELVELAYNITVDANVDKGIFNYMNAIITKWVENGVKTVEQAQNFRADNKPETNKKAHSYDLNEIDEFGMNYLMNRKKKKNEVK